jgi:hypothetical protein
MPPMTAPRTSTTNLEAFRGLATLNGKVVQPGDGAWNEARLAWNLAVDQHPEAVVFPEGADDVRAIVDFARARGLRINVQGTGHNAGALTDMDNTVLVRPKRMNDVEIDVAALTVRVGAGALWADVVDPASEQGLAALAGSARDVAVVGYTLGGGLSFLARKHGLAANHVRAIELVTADGELIRADAESHPDLFWALRGGGGSFGAVTAMELALLPIPQIYAGFMLWPWERATEVLGTWHGMLPGLPEEATTVAKLAQFPPIPEVPELLRGRKLMIVEMFHLGGAESGDELLRPLRELGPELDTVGMVAPAELGHIHMDPPAPVPAQSGHSQLVDAGPEVMATFVEVAGPESGSTLAVVELRQLGGALKRREPGDGATSALQADLNMFAAGMAADEAMAAEGRRHIDRILEGFAPYDAGSRSPNFAEQPTDPSALYPPETYGRLREVKSQYDPANLFRANHEIPPTA